MNINDMNIVELREHLSNLEDCENIITNNGNWWVHPDTNYNAKINYMYNRLEMNKVFKRLDELENKTNGLPRCK